MKTKRLIAMLLAMSMLLTLLAGCGKKNDEKPENTPEPTQRPQYELTDAAVRQRYAQLFKRGCPQEAAQCIRM